MKKILILAILFPLLFFCSPPKKVSADIWLYYYVEYWANGDYLTGEDEQLDSAVDPPTEPDWCPLPSVPSPFIGWRDNQGDYFTFDGASLPAGGWIRMDKDSDGDRDYVFRLYAVFDYTLGSGDEVEEPTDSTPVALTDFLTLFGLNDTLGKWLIVAVVLVLLIIGGVLLHLGAPLILIVCGIAFLPFCFLGWVPMWAIIIVAACIVGGIASSRGPLTL